MAHLVESMFYTREVPWHGLGLRVEDSPTSADALTLAGLDWKVIPTKIQTEAGVGIPGYVANIREHDGQILGVVTNKYKIVQNVEAFDFTDALLGEGVVYDTAGSLNNGKRIWILSKLPSTEILGDEVAHYICFTNAHDGKGAIKAIETPIRVVCNNTLNIALDTATRSFSIKHCGDIQSKLEEAKRVLQLSSIYMNTLKEEAKVLSETIVSDAKFTLIKNNLFPIDLEMSDRRVNAIMENRDELSYRYYNAPDLSRFIGTGWGVMNAVSDYATHTMPRRNTQTYAGNVFNSVLNGHPLLDKALEMVKVA